MWCLFSCQNMAKKILSILDAIFCQTVISMCTLWQNMFGWFSMNNEQRRSVIFSSQQTCQFYCRQVYSRFLSDRTLSAHTKHDKFCELFCRWTGNVARHIVHRATCREIEAWEIFTSQSKSIRERAIVQIIFSSLVGDKENELFFEVEGTSWQQHKKIRIIKNRFMEMNSVVFFGAISFPFHVIAFGFIEL